MEIHRAPSEGSAGSPRRTSAADRPKSGRNSWREARLRERRRRSRTRIAVQGDRSRAEISRPCLAQRDRCGNGADSSRHIRGVLQLRNRDRRQALRRDSMGLVLHLLPRTDRRKPLRTLSMVPTLRASRKNIRAHKLSVIMRIPPLRGCDRGMNELTWLFQEGLTY
jgi:hypothetical protein